MARTNPRIYFSSRDQVFTITVKGLQPITYHNFYFERQRVANTQIKPAGGKLGDLIQTDESGQATFDFYYSSGLSSDATPLEQAQQKANSLSGNKEIVLTTYTGSTLPDNFKDLSQSYTVGHIIISVYIPPESSFTVVQG